MRICAVQATVEFERDGKGKWWGVYVFEFENGTARTQRMRIMDKTLIDGLEVMYA